MYCILRKNDDILLVKLDKLTYVGNLENLKGVEGDQRHVFVQGDICDRELVANLFEKYDFDYVINFAAESHVDRSIAEPEVFVKTNVMGTVNLLQWTKEAEHDEKNKTWKAGKKYLQVSMDEVYGALDAGGHNERENIAIVKTIIIRLHAKLHDDGISEELIKHVEGRLGHNRHYGIDLTKIKNDLVWYPETPFEVGIVKTIDWYLANEEWMDRVTSGAYQAYYAEMYKNK